MWNWLWWDSLSSPGVLWKLSLQIFRDMFMQSWPVCQEPPVLGDCFQRCRRWMQITCKEVNQCIPWVPLTFHWLQEVASIAHLALSKFCLHFPLSIHQSEFHRHMSILKHFIHANVLSVLLVFTRQTWAIFYHGYLSQYLLNRLKSLPVPVWGPACC